MNRKTALIIMLCITFLCACGFLGNYLLNRANSSTFIISTDKNSGSKLQLPQDDGSIGNPISAPVNINTASLDELKSIDGLSQKNAEAILDFRSKYGTFSNIEEIILIPEISREVFLAIESQIYVN